jgi:hypothetical protein
MNVHMLSRGDILRGYTDGGTILDYRLPPGDGDNGHLVTAGDRITANDTWLEGGFAQFQSCPRSQIG